MGTSAFDIRRTTEDDWQNVRALRLAMLADTPIAFAETLDDALGHDEPEWRMRGRRGTAEHGIALAAVDASGRWIGGMGAFSTDQTGPLLVGVYVTPEHRGREAGVTDALLAVIEDWARGEGDVLTLHVHEDNLHARAAYERRGFTLTGDAHPYNLDATRNELVMAKPL